MLHDRVERAPLGRTRAVFASLALATVVVAFGQRADAQVFSESFDSVGVDSGAGPSGLLAKGYVFRKVLDPGFTQDPWKQAPWHGGHPPAFEGTGYLSDVMSTAPFVAGNFVGWILLPSVPGQAANQVISAYVRGATTGNFPIAGSVEIRYSPTGATSTGTTTSSVGDFTQLLTSNSNGTLSGWDHLQVPIPGTGRLAIRWVGSAPFSFSGTTMNFLLDDLTITANGTTPPLPQPGQTVHWTPAMSPIHLTNQQVIPAGGTLIIDAGVSVFFDFTAPLFVGHEITSNGGHIRFEGTAANPVVLRRGINTTEVPEVSIRSAGTLFGNHVDSDCSLLATWDTQFTLRNSTVFRNTPIDWVSLTDSQYQVPKVAVVKGSGLVESCSFTNAIVDLDDAIVRVEHNTFVNALLRVQRFPIAQPLTIDLNTFTQSTTKAPIELDGYDFRLGQNNVIVNNFGPVQLNGAGLTRDSVVPVSGNLENKIRFNGAGGSEIVGPLTLPPLAVPYLVTNQITAGDQYDPHISILAGTTMEMGPDAALFFEGVARIDVLGTPDAPVTFKRSNPSSPWMTFSNASNPPLIIRNARFEGGRWATGGVDTHFFVHDCEFIGNEEGVRVGDICAATIGKSRFENNGIGVRVPWAGLSGIDQGGCFEYGAQNGNSFEGNAQGIVVEPPSTVTSSMQNAWFGSPSGPTTASNPGGTGQSVSGLIDVTPFKTTPVDFTDHPPVVRVKQLADGRFLRAGDKVLLHWDASDDGAIVSQRLEYRGTRGFVDGKVALASIPASSRSVEYTIPNTKIQHGGWLGDGGLAVFRLVCIDDQGQESFDDFHWQLEVDQPLAFSFVTDLSGGFHVGESFDLTISGGTTIEYRLFIDDVPNDWQPLGFGGSTLGASSNTMPAVSTDLARYAIVLNDELVYSPYFTIRPNASFGDQAPQIALTSPPVGAGYSGGQVVPIRWTASDDHGLRSFDLQASYDGRTWHALATDLPGTTTKYDWQLPASTGISNVRVRVIARDQQFQVTSATSSAFAIAPGASVWTDLGSGMAGTQGIPTLSGFGPLTQNSAIQLSLHGARPNVPGSALIVGFAPVNLPLFGGLLVPSPDLVLLPLPTDANGSWSLAATWPAAVPSGFSVYFQTWLPDPLGASGYAASNALLAVTP